MTLLDNKICNNKFHYNQITFRTIIKNQCHKVLRYNNLSFHTKIKINKWFTNKILLLTNNSNNIKIIKITPTITKSLTLTIKLLYPRIYAITIIKTMSHTVWCIKNLCVKNVAIYHIIKIIIIRYYF